MSSEGKTKKQKESRNDVKNKIFEMTSMVISLGAPLFLRGATRQESTIFLFFLATVHYLS